MRHLQKELAQPLVCLLALMLLGSSLEIYAEDAAAPPAREPSGLALTPPMGWNSWNKFGCNVDEQLIRNTADAMVSSGMKDAGYRYVVIDDCWHGMRDADGRIQPDPTRFPSGMRALGDYIHSKGLKFGIYSDAGRKTCGGRPGSQGYEFLDARQYAAWGVDYLKYDWCNTGTRNAEEAYTLMSDALRESGRDIVFSMCEWGTAKPWLWAQNIANLWRTTGDIHDAWEGRKGYSLGVLNILDQQVRLESFAGPGHWNDPDMLEVGNGGMSESEYRAHFSLWAMLAAPLMAGNDIRNMSAATRSILLNREIIAIDQDPLGKQASRVFKDGDAEVWARPLADGARAVLFLNRGTKPLPISIMATALGFPASLNLTLRDLWLGKTLGPVHGRIEAVVEPHAVLVYRVTP
jgi:alpha-galactosidase